MHRSRLYSCCLCLFLLLIALSCTSANHNVSLRDEQDDISCELSRNATLWEQFSQSVRGRYDNDTVQGFSSVTTIGVAFDISCYRPCPGATFNNTSWCFYIYHPNEDIILCLNSSSQQPIFQTPRASALHLEEIISMELKEEKEECATVGCLNLRIAEKYLSQTYAVCSTATDDCSHNSVTEIILNGGSSDARKTHFPPTEQLFVIGEKATLSCKLLTSSVLTIFYWSRNDTVYTSIHESPFCNHSQSVCLNDTTPDAMKAKEDRVRMYLISSSNRVCSTIFYETEVILVFENVAQEDVGSYQCCVTPFFEPKDCASLFVKVTAPPPVVSLPSVSSISSTTPSYTPATTPAIVSTTPTLSPTSPTTSPGTGRFQLTTTSLTTSPGTADLRLMIYTLVPAVSIVILVTVALVILVFGCHRRRSRNKFLPAVPTIPVYSELLKKESQAQLLPPDPMEFPRSRLFIDPSRILGKGAFGKVLKAKAQGIVPHAPQRNIVAVKTLKDNASHSEVNDLWSEMNLMKSIEPHENIINLLGYCTSRDGPLCLIIEYAMHGSLKQFLKSCEETVLQLNHKPLILRSRTRSMGSSCSSATSAHHLLCDKSSSDTPETSKVFFPTVKKIPLATQDSGYSECCGSEESEEHTAQACGMTAPLAHTVAPLTKDYINCKGIIHMEDVQNFALQIACGLQHLENNKIVHCDLAARNILIAEGFVLKVADFGMARKVGEHEYYRKSMKGRIPVKWTAPEALEEYIYTYKSDIWSYGVVLWQIFMYGLSPYKGFHIHQSWEPFISHLKKGNRLPKPDGCPEQFYSVMQRCWELDPDQRPSANDLVNTFLSQSSSNMSTPEKEVPPSPIAEAAT